ncbi:MAG TPA: hypothetical protein VMF64_10565 [Steroidobacteraceae bacterium]|nr:hypothetical protein [Steroidobacteraceae bacterium]
MDLRGVMGSAALAAMLIAGQGAPAAEPAPPGPASDSPPTAEQAALLDLTGNWVSVIDEDWHVRMITPAKGDYIEVPLNAAARQVAGEFNPALYGGANYQWSAIIDCRAYGAPALMHMPTRLHISWVAPDVLGIQTDWGGQTRLLHFLPGEPFGDVQAAARGQAAGAHDAASLQGYSVAVWQRPYRDNAPAYQQSALRGPGGAAPGGTMAAPPGGALVVVTSNLAPGWLRRNGVPYSARTRVTEYYHAFKDPNDSDWFDVTTEVVDPEYLTRPFFTSSDFQRESDGSKWSPHPCKQVSAP